MSKETENKSDKQISFASSPCYRAFSIEDLNRAFEAGRTVKNYKGEWKETYSDNYTSAKYETFNDFIKEYYNVRDDEPTRKL